MGDADLVMNSWKSVMTDSDKHGKAFCIKMFKKHGDIYANFQKNANWTGTPDEVGASGKMDNHVRNFMAGVDKLIQNLKNPGAVLETMKKNHASRGVAKEQYEKAWDCLVEYLSEEGLIKDDTKKAWENYKGAVASGLA